MIKDCICSLSDVRDVGYVIRLLLADGGNDCKLCDDGEEEGSGGGEVDILLAVSLFVVVTSFSFDSKLDIVDLLELLDVGSAPGRLLLSS